MLPFDFFFQVNGKKNDGTLFLFSNHKDNRSLSTTVRNLTKFLFFQRDQGLFSCSIADLYLSETIEYTAPR